MSDSGRPLPALRTSSYLGLSAISGPLVIVEGVQDVGYGETVEIVGGDGSLRRGRVLQVSQERAVVEVWTGTTGLEIESTRVRFGGRSLHIPVAREMLGRVFSGIGAPLDGLPAPIAERMADVNGLPINPTARQYPRNLIVTGISVIDCMNTLIRGQKLPIFSGSGLPHNELAAQIVRQAHLLEGDEPFAVVFVAMGIRRDDAEFFRRSLEESGALSNTAMFLNLASDAPMERIMAPRAGLTLAEHLAFEHGMHILVIMTDMTNYGEALRELGSQRGEVPSRKGYPGYLYSDLASLYERTGILTGRPGSITQVPILVMPSDDISHPIPDLTGYITEGQIVLSRDLHGAGIYPPVSVLPSLSRLMKDGIGEGYTRSDHPALSNQLYAAYAQVGEIRSLAAVVGEEELSAVDRRYLAFGEAFERHFLNQGEAENRSLDETLDLGWKAVSLLPEEELTR
ncbi:MAG: V-type ATP synthase subunit B, partial [Anaerolineae bacterium]|nr:V-type ATP synthase subunit B [Anaerolineae bacterium]